MDKSIKTITLICLLLLSCCLYADAQESYSFGVVPQQSATRLAKLWTPILKKLSADTGFQIKFETAKNIPTFEARLAESAYDFAYMNPYHFTVFNKNPGYQAIAKRINQPIKGIIVVKKDSGISSLIELEGKPLAFPAPAAFAASVLPRAKLTSDKINFTAKYVSSHDSVYLGVSKGIFKAGGGVMRTFNNAPAKVRENLKILWTTKPYTPHAIAAHPKLSNEVAEKFRSALINLNTTQEGRDLLTSIKFKNGLEKANNQDWDDVRGLGIDMLNDLVKQ
ncbi:MAG: phosphonate transport system substrate-binding protein [Oleiphilaceae bacterium]|jgi:phosphonate transport system substrate-binding protein